MPAAPLYSPTSIANRALREVPDRQIGDIGEASLQARECSAAYSDCVVEMLEDHPWTFAVQRAALAMRTNDRPNEWGYAYAVPQDAAFVGKLFPGLAGQANPLGWGGQVAPLPITGGYRQVETFADVAADYTDRAPGWTRIVEAGVIYTDCPMAVCEYTSTAIPEARFTPQFVRALALVIASRISPALTKDATRRQPLWAQAELERQRAKATDDSRQMDTYGHSIPEWLSCR